MDFRARYRRECLLADTAPLHVIESNLGDSSLKFNFFRVPPTEWGPLLTSIEADITLKKIIVTIDYNEYTVNNPTHQLKLKHLPTFIASLSYHISNNANLLDLCLNGIPLSDETVELLVKGLSHSKSLQHLNLSSSKLSNDQALKILSVIERKPKLVWLELCSCSLTSRCKQGLFNLIHNQTVARENAAWKASLREESALLELMGGLRRLSLSDNDLGDAINQLALALNQDNCLKALDLQFCQLEDSHLELLIEAGTKNPALVFIDISNNSGLDNTLVKELRNILKAKVTNAADCPFTPLTLTKRSVGSQPCHEKEKRAQTPNESKRPASTPALAINRKTALQSLKKTIIAKPARSPVKPKSPNRGESAKTRPTKQLSEEAGDNLTCVREELRREKELRLDAERQVIKMYAEMESAWMKISKLEKEVEKLKKQKSTLMSGTYAFPMPYNQPSSLLVDQPTLKDFHVCLGQLRTILHRLSWDPAVSRNANVPLNTQTSGIEGILRNLHSAVNDLALSVNIPERENEPQHSVWTPKVPYEIPTYSQNYARDSRVASALQHSKHETYHREMQMSYDQRLPPDQIIRRAVGEGPNSPVTPGLHQDTPFQGPCPDRNGLKTIPEHRNFTSTPLSSGSAPIRKPQMSPSVLIPNNTKQLLVDRAATQGASDKHPSKNGSPSSSSHSLKDKSLNNIHSTTSSSIREQKSALNDHRPEVTSDQSVPKERITSLKSLQNNLEGLLHQFQTREAEPLEMSRYANSLLPMNDGVSVSEGENARNERSEYSMDFDSTTTSIRTISNELKKLSRNATPSFNNVRPEEKAPGNPRKGSKEKRSNSRSSSTLNLSSIVDLLGDFSVGDIGSSTLTPP